MAVVKYSSDNINLFNTKLKQNDLMLVPSEGEKTTYKLDLFNPVDYIEIPMIINEYEYNLILVLPGRCYESADFGFMGDGYSRIIWWRIQDLRRDPLNQNIIYVPIQQNNDAYPVHQPIPSMPSITRGSPIYISLGYTSEYIDSIRDIYRSEKMTEPCKLYVRYNDNELSYKCSTTNNNHYFWFEQPLEYWAHDVNVSHDFTEKDLYEPLYVKNDITSLHKSVVSFGQDVYFDSYQPPSPIYAPPLTYMTKCLFEDSYIPQKGNIQDGTFSDTIVLRNRTSGDIWNYELSPRTLYRGSLELHFDQTKNGYFGQLENMNFPIDFNHKYALRINDQVYEDIVFLRGPRYDADGIQWYYGTIPADAGTSSAIENPDEYSPLVIYQLQSEDDYINFIIYADSDDGDISTDFILYETSELEQRPPVLDRLINLSWDSQNNYYAGQIVYNYDYQTEYVYRLLLDSSDIGSYEGTIKFQKVNDINDLHHYIGISSDDAVTIEQYKDGSGYYWTKVIYETSEDSAQLNDVNIVLSRYYYDTD